jgi:signal transduction histidine kinase
VFTPFIVYNNCLLLGTDSLIWHIKMDLKPARFSQRYSLALRKYFNQGTDSSLLFALRLGNEAVALGLAARALARIHERALIMLRPLRQKTGKIKGEVFFALATTPFEGTDHATRGSKRNLDRLKTATDRRTVNENAFSQNGKSKSKSLKESLRLQNRLRLLTHRLLAAQEDERRKISCELMEEVAQTLIALNVGLLTLKQKAGNNPNGLEKEIAKTQRLVVVSTNSMRRFAREFDIRPQT